MIAALCAALLGVQEAPEKVSHVKVLSDKVPDVSSMEAWKRSFLKDGMSDEEKALAVWKTVWMFQHQDSPPNEFLADIDPIKIYNVYGYAMCSQASGGVAALARYAGLQARGRILNGHSVPEVFWDGAWHLLDGSLINYFPKADGKLASVDEIMAAVREWYEKNPGFKGVDAKLREFHSADGWTGWKRGPALLARPPTIDAGGWWPAGTHGWYASMQEYDGSATGFYEYGYSQGYQVNIQLRPGERLTRNWSHKGLHVNMKDGGPPGCLEMKVGQDSMRYTPKTGDLANGRVGNGTLEYDIPAAVLQQAAKTGELVVRMPSSYVYITGKISIKARGDVAVAFSDNNGLDWREIGRGAGEIDLSPHVFRRYDYRLKLKSAALDGVRIVHDIQHSQRPLPALGQGKNTITFSAGPPEGTVTIEGSTDLKNKGKQLVYTDFHPRVTGLGEPNILVNDGARGEITFPVTTPGDLVRLRFGSHHRVRDARDAWDYQVSFDGGKSFKTAGQAKGPTPGHCTYVVSADVPAGTREALVRFAGGPPRNALMLFDFRIDADYREPAGGFRPVKVTYAWEEEGVPKRDVHVARKPQETWTITCAAKPVMKSIVLELAD